MTGPAAISTSTSPVTKKKRDRLSFSPPLKINQPMTIATTIPTSARADPHLPQGIPPTLLGQERGHDPDDQGGFEAFAKADDERRKHANSARGMCVCSVNLTQYVNQADIKLMMSFVSAPRAFRLRNAYGQGSGRGSASSLVTTRVVLRSTERKPYGF